MADVPAALRKALAFWEWPFVAALAGFMFWIRMMPYRSVIEPETGRVYFIGYSDPFYHYRATLNMVRNFPFGIRWDPWTHYPVGTATGQFSSLFDWVLAAFVVARHGRDAATYDIAVSLAVYTAVVGALVVVPFYFLARRLFGAWPAVAASLTLAVLGGGFLRWGLAGAGDHHVAEALMSVVSILGVHYAAERGHALRERVHRDETWRLLLPVGLAGAVGALALAANLLVWPPAILFAGLLTAWLTLAILIENAKEDGDARGLAAGGALSMAGAGLVMAFFVDSTFLGEFNTYGVLHVIAPLLAAAWLVGVHAASRFERRHGWQPWVVPAIVAAAGVLVYGVLRVFFRGTFASIAWGLSWITGIGTQRTTSTIGEARQTTFFCTEDALREGQSCLQNEYGVLAQVGFFLLIAVVVYAVWRRRRADILLALWGFLIFRAVDTQSRFSYYLAVVLAMLVGWLALRLAGAAAAAVAPSPVVKRGKRKKREREVRRAEPPRGRLVQAGAALLALLVVLPGNVFASDDAVPPWEVAPRSGGINGEMQMWLDGLDWARANTPDAGVDLAARYERPPSGERFDYPPESYGVLSWWDYGHWIQAMGLRPPVANPFQQAAPFAATWFTEREPARAEALLDAWVGEAPPVRYVWIDEEMPTGKYHAITTWANSQNASRARWAEGEYLARRAYDRGELLTLGPEYTESMMGRMYDFDANGLSHYRLVWEAADYVAVGNVANPDGQARCIHDVIPSRACPVGITSEQVFQYREGTTVDLGDGVAYDLRFHSRLKLFERVEGAALVGEAAPGSQVIASARIGIAHPDGSGREWRHDVTTVADGEGRYRLVFPYPTTDLLSTDEGATLALAQAVGPVIVTSSLGQVEVDVPERAVLDGAEVPVVAP